MPLLSVPVFGGGVVLEGSADAHRTDELAQCDGYDIGPRGQLVAASELGNFAYTTGGTSTPLVPLYGLGIIAAPRLPLMVFVGDEGGQTYYGFLTLNGLSDSGTAVGATPAGGVLATFVAFPYVTGGVQQWVMLVCIAARFFQHARDGWGLFAMEYDPASGTVAGEPIEKYDALGTGPDGEFTGGNLAVQLYPRFIAGYNNFAFLFGFDNHDATHGDGPTRVMFSNVGNPLKFGLDPEDGAVAEGTGPGPGGGYDNHAFTDSDAFTMGGAGEVCRGACVWDSKLFVGTNRGLHYIEGFGRDDFMTNGALAVKQTRPIVGPHAIGEGPDGLLYGVAADVGLWAFDGSGTDPVGMKLRGYDTKSNGFWDLIWTDTTRTLLQFPGQSNQDLVWLLMMTELNQVWVVIPYCSIANGYGYGTDTVVLKYHVTTGGFSRQLFPGKILLAGTVFQAEQSAQKDTFVCAPGMAPNVQYYAHKINQSASPPMPSSLPVVTFGPYAPFGPDGTGVMRKRYLTLSWESAGALPLVFTLTPTIDGQTMPALTLTIGATQPGSPANGDVWVDTSGTDTNLGNGTAGSIIGSNPADYIIRRYITTWSGWRQVPGGGQQGTRISIPIAFDPRKGTRFSVQMVCTSAGARYQVEGFGEKPALVREAM